MTGALGRETGNPIMTFHERTTHLRAFLTCGGKPVASPERERACIFRSLFVMIKELLFLLVLTFSTNSTRA